MGNLTCGHLEVTNRCVKFDPGGSSEQNSDLPGLVKNVRSNLSPKPIPQVCVGAAGDQAKALMREPGPRPSGFGQYQAGKSVKLHLNGM